jgi:4-hydroxybenzoate polyprenyltransferase
MQLQDTQYFYPVFSWKFWRAFLVHMRPYLLFVSGIAGLSGMSVGNEQDIKPGVFLMAFIPFFLGYGFGQALTDCFQIDTDSISAPYRPLVKKEVSPKSVGIVSIIGLVLISISVIYLNLYNLIWGVLSVTGLITYTYFKRNFWFAGPFYNGWIVMLLPIMGYMAVSDIDPGGLFNRNVLFLALLTLFAYANFVLIGYLKDISADRATHYKTFPVVFGWNKTLFLGDIFVAVSIFACYVLIGHTFSVSFLVFLAASVVSIVGQLYGHFTRQKVETNTSLPISSTVRSFILWHVAVILYFHPTWLLFVMIYYVCFEIFLYMRPEREQI